MQIEVAVLTGGASRRMGRDKSLIPIGGIPQGERIVRGLLHAGYPVTVLGPVPIGGADFQPDGEPFAGPLVALSQWAPSAEATFVVACDLPLFDPRVVPQLAAVIGSADAAVPVYEGHPQPLCALYRSTAFASIPEVIREGRRSLMAWLDKLACVEVHASQLSIRPEALASANTPEELKKLMESAS